MDTIAVIDFGGQYTHLIANRIRRLGVYSEIVAPDIDVESCRQYRGIILSGSPHSVCDQGSPAVSRTMLSLSVPVLGLCYGHQLLSKLLDGEVSHGRKREYGIAELTIVAESPLFKTLSPKQQIWMSHGDAVDVLPQGFSVLASTPECTNAAIGDHKRNIYGLQFHPEVTDTPNGMVILDNFLAICGCAREWNTKAYREEITRDIVAKCDGKKVFLLVSGGVDSTVAFTLFNNTLGPQRVLGLHIDNGLMRLDESENIIAYMKKEGFDNLHVYDASQDFLRVLEHVTGPEEKRVIIGNEFIAVKERAQESLGLNCDDWLLAQGTIYPDTIESAGSQHADKIKTHHNRVDIILELIKKGLVIEPLAQLYKDEVRLLGEELGIPHSLLWRHPFPGPGLGVRVICSDKTETAINTETSAKVRSIAASYGYHSSVLPVRSVGVQGDSRTYAHPALVIGPRDWTVLETVSTRITNTIREVNRVVYGIALNGQPDYTPVQAYMTQKRLDLLRMIDHCVTTVLHETGEYERVWQMPVVLLPLVNSEGNASVVLRPIVSQEAMTARFYPLNDTALKMIVTRAQEIKGIGDLFFDITHKPPGTIEWE